MVRYWSSPGQNIAQKKIAVQLSQAGLSTTSLQGNLSQSKRDQAMDLFRRGRVKIMVATDIAARGIDVSQVSHVINFDIPDTVDAYTHRTGRSGRMGRLGTALTLVTREDYQMVRTIERVTGQNFERREVEGQLKALPPIKQVDNTKEDRFQNWKKVKRSHSSANAY